MKRPTIEPEPAQFPALSKRAAGRLIQRAFVLVGRDKSIRQQLREASLITLWRLEDWGLEWTVAVEGGKFQFHRGKAGRPQLTYSWRSVDHFFYQIERGGSDPDAFHCDGSPELRRLFGPVFVAFSKSLSG